MSDSQPMSVVVINVVDSTRPMYGCRDAAQCWEAEITDFFTSIGFTPGIGSPVLFVNLTRNIRVTISW